MTTDDRIQVATLYASIAEMSIALGNPDDAATALRHAVYVLDVLVEPMLELRIDSKTAS